MYKRLSFCVLLVMLSGRFGGTYAENDTTTAQNTVTHATNMPITSTNDTAMGNSTMTTSITQHSTTTPTNSTMTTPMMNVSITASTQLVPVSPNTTVVTLESNITKAECGSKQLCVSEPSTCDPSVPGSCFFIAAKQESGRNFNFGLSGESDGYIAATLTGGLGEGEPTYVCAKSKDKVKFFSTVLFNGVLNISTLNVNSVKGKINGRTIQCSFLTTVPEPKARTTLGLKVSTGAYNDTNDNLGAPAPIIRVASVDLANPNNNVTNEITNTTTPTNSTMTTPMMNVSITASTQLVPVSPNTTVVTLETNITKAECGTKQLCVSEPSTCDPSEPGSCFFIAAKQESGQNFNFGLSGESDGYIAATLTDGNGQVEPTYVCAKSKDKVKFFSTILTNGVLSNFTLNVNSVKGKINGKTIQCSFLATVPQPLLRATTLGLKVSTGAYNDTNDSLGAPVPIIRVASVDLANPNNNVTNEITSTTTPPVTGNEGVLIPQLPTNINREACGSTKLCAAEPSKCDPATGSCYFLSVKQQSGQIYNFELSGQSDGYVAAGLSTGETQTGTHIAYICANDNGKVRFFTGAIENQKINLTRSQNSSSQQGRVDGNKIQCTFSADLPDTTVRSANYALSITRGTFDAIKLLLGNANFQLLTKRVDLSDPTLNLTNLLNYAHAPSPSFLSALLVTVCMLVFTVM